MTTWRSRSGGGTLGAAAITALGVARARILDLRRRWQPVGCLRFAVMVGLVVGLAHRPDLGVVHLRRASRSVKEIARQSQTGPATVVISGLAEGMRSAAFSVLVVAGGILGAFTAGQWALGDGGGVYGVTIAAIGVLATVGITISVDAYGPIADNAGGIAQMAHLPSGGPRGDRYSRRARQHDRRRGQRLRHRVGGCHCTGPRSPLSPRLPGSRRST